MTEATPHYHILLADLDGRTWRRLDRAWRSRSAAIQWAQCNHPDRERIVRQCFRPECKPHEEAS